MAVLIRDVTLPLERRPIDLRVRRGIVVEAAPGLPTAHGEQVVEGRGGRLLPTLADDHLHIGAWMRAQRSKRFPDAGLDTDACRRIGREAPGAAGWTVLFGIDHHHDIAPALDLLERHVPHPVLLVHRTGHAAFATRSGQIRLAAMGRQLGDVGACWRACLGPATSAEEAVLLRRLRDRLLAAGVADIHDATPYSARMAERVAWITQAMRPVRVLFMGLPGDPLEQATHLKVFDSSTPAPGDRPLAIHAVEPYEINSACQVVGRAGRIEHAALCPPALVAMVAATGCTVCANPGFLVERAAALAPLLPTGEAEFLQPLAELHDAAIRITFGSDAPVGEPGPWSAIRGAQRRGAGGIRFPGALFTFDEALRCAVGKPELVDPTACDWVGRCADFTVLAAAKTEPLDCDAPVVATIIGGRLAFDIAGGARDHV